MCTTCVSHFAIRSFVLCRTERQISQGFVEQLHRDNAAEVQPQATEVSQPGAQGPPALHERGNAGGDAGEERHLPGLSGAGGDLTT